MNSINDTGVYYKALFNYVKNFGTYTDRRGTRAGGVLSVDIGDRVITLYANSLGCGMGYLLTNVECREHLLLVLTPESMEILDIQHELQQ